MIGTRNPYESGNRNMMKNPCEILARVGFAALLASPNAPEDEFDSESIQEAQRLEHRAVAEVLLSSAPKARPNGHGVRWLDRTINWPDRAPHLKTWAGNQTLEKLILARQAAMRGAAPEASEEAADDGTEPLAAPEAPPDEQPAKRKRRKKIVMPLSVEQAAEKIGDLFAFGAPFGGTSGFDPVLALDPRDVGFSPNDIGLPIFQRPALELLAILGANIVPLVSFGYRQCGFIFDGKLHRFSVEARSGGYLFQWGWISAEPDAVEEADELAAAENE